MFDGPRPRVNALTAGAGTDGAVIGVLVIGGASLDDYPDDIERRFKLTASELSRLTGRVSLLDRWKAATTPDPLVPKAPNGKRARRTREMRLQ